VSVSSPPPVEFIAPTRKAGSERRSIVFGSVLLLGCAVWSAGIAVTTRPLLGAVAALVWIEIGLAWLRLAFVTGDTVRDGHIAGRVAPLLADVCQRARCTVPPVMLRSDAVRPAGVKRIRNRPVLLLSRVFVQRVDDAALRAVLAHEVAHIVNGDLAAARRRERGALMIGAVAGATAVIVIGGNVGEVMPIWLGAEFAATILATAALSVLNRPRELRADADAVALCGDPAAVARGVAAADAQMEEVRRSYFGGGPVRWLLAPLSWRMPSHPPAAQRVATLQALSATAGTNSIV
jgi:Zn-dependent protease with chaperone function